MMRNASSILLLANAQKYNSMKVLMIKRHTKARFMANMYVFPGGVLEDFDGAVANGVAAEGTDPLLPFRKAAIRELWEETSVALDAKGAATGKAAQPDYSLVNSISPLSHWITPVGEKYRYDTWFFAHGVSNDDEAAAMAMEQCPRELADLQWVEPAEALRRHNANTPAMDERNEGFCLPPPTYLMLEYLQRFPTKEAFLEDIGRRYGRNPTQTVPCVLPTYIDNGDGGDTMHVRSGAFPHYAEGRHKIKLFGYDGVMVVGDQFMPKKAE